MFQLCLDLHFEAYNTLSCSDKLENLFDKVDFVSNKLQYTIFKVQGTVRVLSAVHTKTKWIGHNPQPAAAGGAHTTTQVGNQLNLVRKTTMPKKLSMYLI